MFGGIVSMHFDYIDIGTSDFDVADGIFARDKNYLLVEPMAEYLERLPSGPNIIKECVACSDIDGFLDLYYIPPEDIQKLGLPDWVRGCNRLNKHHKTVSNLLQNTGISSEAITTKKVPTMRFDTICEKHDICSAGFVKIDTEGHDHVILKQIASRILHDKFSCEFIKVEYIRGGHDNTDQLDEIVYTLRKVMTNFKFDSENLTIW